MEKSSLADSKHATRDAWYRLLVSRRSSHGRCLSDGSYRTHVENNRRYEHLGEEEESVNREPGMLLVEALVWVAHTEVPG